jgi:hypothetical protein
MENRKTKFSENFKDALNESVMSNAGYAINRIIKSKSIVIKSIWLLSLLVFSALASYLCVSSITSYYDRETVSKITVFHEIPMEFPTITFCNLSPFQTNFSLEVLHELIQNTTKYFETSQKPFPTNSVGVKYYFMSYINDLIKNNVDKKNLSLSLASMLISCSFDFNDICNLQDFEWYFDFYYGNCFRFNSKGDKKLYKNGKLAGFRLELNIGTYLPMLWQYETGIHIFIHNKSQRISMYEGIDAPIGKMTNIAINRIVTNKVEAPYSECVENLDKQGSKYYEILKKHNLTYQRSDCLDLCFSDYAFQKFGCREGSTSRFFEEPICKSIVQLNFLGGFLLKFYNLKTYKECNCPFECHSNSYTLSTSFSTFSNADLTRKLSKIENPPGDTLALNIYFEELKYTIIDEKIKTNWKDLLSNIGGVTFFNFFF